MTRLGDQPAPTLGGTRVRLVPLALDHVEGLTAAATEDRGTYDWTAVPTAGSMAAYVHGLLAEADAGATVPYVQVRAVDGTVVGATRFLHIRDHAVEIGGTWLSAGAQRTGINREAKLLLLGHAFDALGLERVDLCTDARNERSRTAIAGLGATFEGVLRNWQASRVPGEEGRCRDTAIFSVVRPEWPRVRNGLVASLR